MASKTQIVNVALQRIGFANYLANVDTETSPAARAAQASFEIERDFVLRAFPWPFATKYETLALVDGSSDDPVNNDWTFAYRFPADCLRARRIVRENGRLDTDPPRFRIGRDSQGRLIYSDEEEAVLEYTVRITDPAEFDANFVSAFAWRLAWMLAPALGRVAEITKTARDNFYIELTTAKSEALNEGQQESPIDAEWIRGRD